MYHSNLAANLLAVCIVSFIGVIVILYYQLKSLTKEKRKL